MNLHIDKLTIEHLNLPLPASNDAFQSKVLHLLGEILKQGNIANNKLNTIMGDTKNLEAQIADLQVAVADESTVVDSAVVLIEGNIQILTDLKKDLEDAKGDQPAIDAVAAKLGDTINVVKAKKEALAKAVSDGTPAATDPGTGTGTTDPGTGDTPPTDPNAGAPTVERSSIGQ